MKADYDSRADALLIQLLGPGLCDGAVEVDRLYCHVDTRKGRVASIELLNPAAHLDLLKRAADRLGLDSEALLAAAEAALAAPDRPITVEVGDSAASATAA
ncbi:MAG TPA: hypothetical protein VGV69_09330 [Solirubrobacterales bacterium]|nr:hypothetical protein [Solirubrobacterales bacterium]